MTAGSKPAVTVIIPAYKRFEFLERAARSILDQDIDGDLELIIVASGDDPADLEPLDTLPSDDRLTVLKQTSRMRAAPARNLGAERAHGLGLAFTDADAIPRPGWLRGLIEASGDNRLCVGGAVVNGTKKSVIGTTEYMVEFVDLHPRRPARSLWHGALVNLYVPRELWDRFGPFPENLIAGEDTLFTATMRLKGLYAFAPDAPVEHLNRTRFRELVSHQYLMGRSAAELGRVSPYYKVQPLVKYTFLAPVAAIGRLPSVYARALAWMKGERLRVLLCLPAAVVALAAWGAGLFTRGRELGRDNYS